MEQSANPVARVGHYTRIISTSTQNASIWSLTAAAQSDSRALCTNLLIYLLTYCCCCYWYCTV